MIKKDEMLPILVVACPSFTDKWRQHKQEFQDEEDYLLYVALGEFARHLIELAERNQTDEFEFFFESVEKIHHEGEGFVREAVTIGLLESLQNNAENCGEKFVKFLKPESLKWWTELNKFWKGENKFVGETINGKSKFDRKIIVHK